MAADVEETTRCLCTCVVVMVVCYDPLQEEREVCSFGVNCHRDAEKSATLNITSL